MTRYRYTVNGTARDGVSWSVSGTVEAPGFTHALSLVMQDAYSNLTEGRATHGDLTTCQGPYQFTKMTIEKVQA